MKFIIGLTGQSGSGKTTLYEKAIEMGLDIVVESEGCDPTGKEEVERCIDYLRVLDPEL